MHTPQVSGLPTASGRLQQVMRQHPLFFFFLMAYAFSWVMLIPFVLSEWSILHGDFRIAFALNPFVGPTLAAYIMTHISEGHTGVLRQRQRLLYWRVGPPWYAFALLGIPALHLLGIAVLPGALASFQGLPRGLLITYIITFGVIAFLGGPLGEEIGWRGFALPRLQACYGPLWGTLMLGVLWTCWHLPHFLTSTQRGGPETGWVAFLTNFSIFFLLIMASTIVFTWVFNHTHESVFIAILVHASINTSSVITGLFSASSVTRTDLAMLIGIGSAALLMVILTHGRLGYRVDQAQASEPISSCTNLMVR